MRIEKEYQCNSVVYVFIDLCSVLCQPMFGTSSTCVWQNDARLISFLQIWTT